MTGYEVALVVLKEGYQTASGDSLAATLLALAAADSAIAISTLNLRTFKIDLNWLAEQRQQNTEDQARVAPIRAGLALPDRRL